MHAYVNILMHVCETAVKKFVYLRNEVYFPCFHALMKTEVRLGEFESRSVQIRDVVKCLNLLENFPNIPRFVSA
jgi:hypothetical protein